VRAKNEWNGVMRMADEQKDGFVFYRSYIEAAEELPEERRWPFIRDIAKYALDGVEPEFTGLEKMAFIIIRRNIDSGYRRYKASKENGKKGGNPNFKKGQPNPYYKGRDFSNVKSDNITQDNLTETETETETVTVTESKQSQYSVSEERAPKGAPPPRKRNELTPEDIARGWRPVIE
jgi:hypothetical protein